MLTIIKLLLLYFAYQLGFSGLFMAISRFVIPMDATTMTSLTMVASTILMAWHLIHFGHIQLSRDKYKDITLPVLGVSIVFVFSATYVLNLLIEQASIPNTMEDTFIDMSRNPFGILTIGLMAPILEELLFRGAIQGYLQKVCKKPWSAIIISSLIFGVVHMNPAQIPFAFLLGMMFGWLYYRTGSLLPGIVGHALNNTIAGINMIIYGNATIEEQIENPIAMWAWSAVAMVIFILSTIWLNRNLNDKSLQPTLDESDQSEDCE